MFHTFLFPIILISVILYYKYLYCIAFLVKSYIMMFFFCECCVLLYCVIFMVNVTLCYMYFFLVPGNIILCSIYWLIICCSFLCFVPGECYPVLHLFFCCFFSACCNVKFRCVIFLLVINGTFWCINFLFQSWWLIVTDTLVLWHLCGMNICWWISCISPVKWPRVVLQLPESITSQLICCWRHFVFF